MAPEALHTAPETVIPLLLELAVGDRRELHSTPNQPLRLIKDWANSGVPGRGEAVRRKRIVVRCALAWVASGKDFNTACRACSEVLRTVYEGTETDPGSGTKFDIVRGMLTDEEIAELGPIWDEMRVAIVETGEAPWPTLLSACWELIHPHVFDEYPAQVFEESRRFGETVIKDLGEMAGAHPGVLVRLNTMRQHLGHDALYSVPEDYVALFGKDDHTDWERDEQERAELITQLAKKWATGDPAEFTQRLNWLHREAAVAGANSYDRSPFLCHHVAKRVDDPAHWLTVLAAAKIPAICLLPFLERVVQDSVEDWEAVALPILNDPALEYAAVDVGLRVPHLTDTMWPALSPRLARYHQLTKTLCFRRQVPLATLRRLLHHDSIEVTHATAVGMWTGEKHGAIPDELRQEWENAVVAIDGDEHWLKKILAFSPAVAIRWLKARIEKNDWNALWNRENVQTAVAGLDDTERFDMLHRLHGLPDRFHLEGVTMALLGDSDQLYRRVLRDRSLTDLWEDPVRRRADEAWRRYAGIALEEGRSPGEVAEASVSRSDSWWGPHSMHLQGQIDEFAVWLQDPVGGIREVARLMIERFSASREQALADERKEAIEGFG